MTHTLQNESFCQLGVEGADATSSTANYIIYGRNKGEKELPNNFIFKQLLNNRKFTAMEMYVFLAVSTYDNIVQKSTATTSGDA